MLQPTTISQEDAKRVFELRDADRAMFFKQLGARNCDPPLPHSPCLRNKQTGAILPWEPILAEQTEILECCDEEGNTDPAAWMPKVVNEGELDPQEAQMMALHKMRQHEQMQTFVNNELKNSGIQMQAMPVMQPAPEDMPHGAVSFEDFNPAPAPTMPVEEPVMPLVEEAYPDDIVSYDKVETLLKQLES